MAKGNEAVKEDEVECVTIPIFDEHLAGRYTGGQPGDTYGTADGNKGLYGVDVSFVVKVVNGSLTNKNLGSRVAARNAGVPANTRGKFWGAADMEGLPLENMTCGIPKLHYGGSEAGLEPWTAAMRWFANLPTKAVGPSFGHAFIVYNFVIGAAANLPASLLLNRTALVGGGPPPAGGEGGMES